MTTKEKKLSGKNKLADFRLKRSIITMQVNAVRSQEMSVVAKDKKSFQDLQDFWTRMCWQCWSQTTSNDYEGFCRIDPYIRTFWDSITVVDGCVIIDDRIAIPQCLQKAVLSRLHHSHPGQEALIDAAQYVWWPQIHRDIVTNCKKKYPVYKIR